MTDLELYQIVKDHEDAWPEDVRLDTRESGEPYFVLWGSSFPYSELAFEASFHRALMARGDDRGDVYAKHFRGTYTVQIDDREFYGGSLIEAYAKALEWLK